MIDYGFIGFGNFEFVFEVLYIVVVGVGGVGGVVRICLLLVVFYDVMQFFVGCFQFINVWVLLEIGVVYLGNYGVFLVYGLNVYGQFVQFCQ